MSKEVDDAKKVFSVIPSFAWLLWLCLALAFCDHEQKERDLHDILIEQADKADLFGTKDPE